MAFVRQILIPRRGKGGVRLDTLMTKQGAPVRTGYVRESRHTRNGMILSTTSWFSKGRFIQLFVNPREITWSVPRRETVVKTAAGAVRNTWRNRYRNTYLDEFMLNITFQTGNIMPSRGTISAAELLNVSPELLLSDQRVGLPPGLQNFYEFWEMVDQPALLGPFENRHMIIMHTRAFPILRLEGYFTGEPVTWTESADNANQLVWQANFQVYRTIPRLTNFAEMASVYRNWSNSQGRREALPPNPQDPPEPTIIQAQRLLSLQPSASRLRSANPFAQGLEDLSLPSGTGGGAGNPIPFFPQGNTASF